MLPVLPSGQMSVEEKIQTMETIWDDLCHLADDVTPPGWHREILAERSLVRILPNTERNDSNLQMILSFTLK